MVAKGKCPKTNEAKQSGGISTLGIKKRKQLSGVVLIIEVIYGALLGAIAGLAVHRISLFQIKRRSSEPAKIEAVENPAVIALCILITGALFALVFWKYSKTIERLEYLFYMLVALNISITDIDIRKIPNESVLSLMVVRTAVMIASIVKGAGFKETVFPSLLGLGIGFVLYMLPSLMGVMISPGDVKYCAAIGYCLGIYGYLEAAVVMAVSVLIYLVYLKLSKKGGVKTVTMMGPHLSVGVVVAVLLPYKQIIDLVVR